MRKVIIAVFAAMISAGLLCGCKKDLPSTTQPAKENVTIRLATTTSTENSGLLAYLLPEFTKETGIEVQVIAQGTGQALKTAENGDCDVVMVHARKAEDKFVAEGWGVNRRDLMYNDFIIVGPPDDPAKIKGTLLAPAAMRKIAMTQSPFCSRGDKSGTHIMELDLWKACNAKPEGQWFRELGKGMGETLIQADQMKAYTLADRGTWLAIRSKLPGLTILLEGDPALRNPYGVLAVNPEKHKQAKYDAAMKFIDWLTSPHGQQLIADFKIDGQQLFFPDARPAGTTTISPASATQPAK